MSFIKRIGFLGPIGTFSEEAARKCFSHDPSAQFVPFPTIPDVLEATEYGEVDLSVVPLENSVEGAVNVTLDWLAHDGDLFVVGEELVPVRQNLVGLQSASIEGIVEVSSHPQALAQCRKYLRNLKGLSIKTADSTAAAVEQVSKLQDPSIAAIGTEWAAKKYGLKILESNIQDFADNVTRFFVVTKKENVHDENTAIEGPFKTSLLITLESDHVGALVYILNVFSAVGINLTRIESRPTRKNLGSYWFFVDVEGHSESSILNRALQAIGTFGHEVRILGTYPDSFKLSKKFIDS